MAILTHFDQALGRFPYMGMTLEQQRPVAPQAIKKSGFEVVVASHRYGKGSSLEHWRFGRIWGLERPCEANRASHRQCRTSVRCVAETG